MNKLYNKILMGSICAAIMSFFAFTAYAAPTPVNLGGTGTTTIPSGSLIYGNTTQSVKTLPIGGVGKILQSNGTTPQWVSTSTLGIIASAITNLNGQTGATQVFATSSSGTVFDIQSSGDVHTFIFPSDPTFSTLNLTNTTNSGNIVYYNGTTLIGGDNGFNWDGTSLAVGSSGTHTATLDVSGSLRFNGQLLLDASAGNAGDFLVSNGAGVVPVWSSAASAGLVTTSRTINTTAPLTGGGNLSGDLTLALTTPLAVTYGGIGTTTLGNLTVGTNLSVSGGQRVLIGTSTQISLGTNVVTTLSTGTSGTIFNGSISSNTLTLNLPFASGSNTGQLQSADWTTFNNKLSTIGSGNTGFLARWNGANTLAQGVVADNGTVAGVNATSSAISFNVQGSTTLDPFNVASSSGTSFLRVTQAGNVGVNTTSPTKAFEVWANQTGGVARITRDVGTTIAPSTYYGTMDLRVHTTSSTLTTFPNLTGSVLTFTYSTSTNPTAPVTTNDIVGVRFGNDTSGALLFRPYYLGVASPGLILSANSWGNEVTINTTTGYSTLYVQAGTARDAFTIASSSGADMLRILPNGSTTISSLGVSGCDVFASATGSLFCGVNGSGGGSPGGTGGQAQYNNGGAFAGSSALLTNGTVSGVNATSSATSFTVKGTSALNPFNVTSSTNTSLLSVDVDGNLFSYRANSSYAQQQFALSSALNGGVMFYVDSYGSLSGGNGAYTLTPGALKVNSNGGTSTFTNYNNSNNSNLQIFTGYGFAGLNANQYLQLGYSGSGSVINSYILNGVGKTTIGTVAPTPGTSTVTTPSLLVEDTSGNSIAPIFAVASSTNTIIFQVNYDGKVGINTSTPAADFQATNQISSATTTIEFGRAGQGKGTCMKIYDPAGVAWYVSVSTAGTLSASATTCKTGF